MYAMAKKDGEEFRGNDWREGDIYDVTINPSIAHVLVLMVTITRRYISNDIPIYPEKHSKTRHIRKVLTPYRPNSNVLNDRQISQSLKRNPQIRDIDWIDKSYSPRNRSRDTDTNWIYRSIRL